MSARDLRKYWAGQTLSTFGSVFTAIAMPIVAVEHLDATPAQIGLISAASFVPMVLLGLPAGALADRIARPRRALIILDTFSALAVAVVALGVATDTATVGWLAALAAAQGGALILLEVVYFIHLNQLVEAGELGPARAKLQAGQYAAGFVGRLLVGPTIVLLGAPAAIAVDAVTYLLSVAALLAMGPVAPLVREPIAAAGGAVLDTLRGMTAGLKFFVSDAFHRTLLLFFLVPGAAMAGAAALTAPFVLRVLGVPQAAYGMLFAATGLLGLAGSMLAGRILRSGHNAARVTLVAFTASLASALLLPLSPGSLPVAAVFAAAGIGLPVFFGAVANVAISPVIVADAAEDEIGRTVALLKVLAAVAALGGALAGGLLGDTIGVRPAIWSLQLAGLLIIGICLPAAFRAVRPRADVPDGLSQTADSSA
ncbi:MFS transporter [Amorphoplanes digitatis]|uniref:MFS family permease n=1 Tax=Actinoplanes digitatis TaxID=1868 RepID=A0A7W7MP31_9ACTN|nr:MFS transporter [Actinoplanes digitatis]MBB4761661.1 MFS family permease [Actinoplanes digitatis]GID90771.1 MFS transporter [Actinoplanes digitatis]